MPQTNFSSRVREYAHYGLQFGVVYTCLATMILIVRTATAAHFDLLRQLPAFIGVLAFYPLAGIVAGALFGALQPLARGLFSRALVGSVVAFPVMVGMLPFVADKGVKGSVWGFLCLTSVIFGTVGSLVFSTDEPRER